MMHLKEMTAKEAVRAAKEESGLTAERIARGLHVSSAVVKRYLKKGDPYFPGLETLPRLCLVLGNTLLLDWIAAQIDAAGKGRRQETFLDRPDASSLLEKARLLVAKAENLAHPEEIKAALNEVEAECGRLKGFLEARNGGCDKRKEQ